MNKMDSKNEDLYLTIDYLFKSIENTEEKTYRSKSVLHCRYCRHTCICLFLIIQSITSAYNRPYI